MGYTLLKWCISATLIVAVSEASKRSGLLGGLLASLPLVSLLGLIWLWIDTRDVDKVVGLSWSVLWLVLPSLALFVALPLLLKKFSFWPSLGMATAIMFCCYGATLGVLRAVGFEG